MVPTLLWSKEITSTSDADSESMRQGVGCGWSPRDPQHLAWGWARVKHSGKLQRAWKQVSATARQTAQGICAVHLLQEQRSNPFTEGRSRAGCVLELLRACSQPTSIMDSFPGPARLTGDHICSPLQVCAPGLLALHLCSWLPYRWTLVGSEHPFSLPSALTLSSALLQTPPATHMESTGKSKSPPEMSSPLRQRRKRPGQDHSPVPTWLPCPR